MPPQEDRSSISALLGQVATGGGAAGSGIADALGLKTANDLYVGIIKSRTIADALIQRFKLQEYYNTPTLVDTRRALEKRSTITAGKDGLIAIEYDDVDPKRAAEMANAYVEELDRLTMSVGVTQSSRRRMYFQSQLSQAKQSLARAEDALRATQEKTGLIRPEDQVRPIIEALASLQGQIVAKEVQITALLSFSTERNPEVLRARTELAGMKAQLATMQKNSNFVEGDVLVPTSKVPEAGLEYVRAVRDVAYNEALFQALAKQYELAKVDEGRNAFVIQVVDSAIVLDKKSKPSRTLIVVISTFVAGILALLTALMQEKLERLRSTPDGARKLENLWNLIRWRGGT
jgi:uncharacterized protein involved in exopolysaccharide biosynthesis